jgi:hypothetical protein
MEEVMLEVLHMILLVREWVVVVFLVDLVQKWEKWSYEWDCWS